MRDAEIEGVEVKGVDKMRRGDKRDEVEETVVVKEREIGDTDMKGVEKERDEGRR